MHTGMGLEEGRNGRDVGGLRNNAVAEEKPRTAHLSPISFAECQRLKLSERGRTRGPGGRTGAPRLGRNPKVIHLCNEVL